MNRIHPWTGIRCPNGRWARRGARAAALATALACAPAPALEIVPRQGQSPEQVERDKSECMALAREATDAEPESGGALRISEPVLVGEQPADEAQQGAAAADESAGQDRATGLFAGLRHGETEAAVEWRTRREAAVTRIEDELERAYAACLEARGYTVNPRP